MLELIDAKPAGGYRIHLRLGDGAESEVNIAECIALDGVFAALRDPNFFAQFRVDPDWGTLSWPGDLDLAPEPLWERMTGRKIAALAV